MKKRRKNRDIYDSCITMENLYQMWLIIKRTCKNRREVYYFSLNLNTNIRNIYLALKNKTYKPDKYKTFMIFEPKPRLVMSQTVADKIVNHFVANYYLIPCLEHRLIDSNVATRKNKGSGYAMKLLKKYFNKLLINYPNQEIFCLKIDISKYFYSISHDILLHMLGKKIKDQDVLNLIHLIISETNSDYVNRSIQYYNMTYHTDIPCYLENTGLSIGAMSSQFLAIFYLNIIDHYIKEELHCKYYIRYMDDFLILDSDKDMLKEYYRLIVKKIEGLKLKVNKKSNIYRSSRGFSFLGYTYKVINNKLNISYKKDTYIRIQKRLSYLKKEDIVQYRKSMGSYYGYFDGIRKIQRENLKMSSKELYSGLKKKYSNYLLIIKEKVFYKIYSDDAKLIWYLFHYKYYDSFISFGNKSFDRVIGKLRKLNLNFAIVSLADELLVAYYNDSIYLEYLELAKKTFYQFQMENKLISKLRGALHSNLDYYEEINTFLESLLLKQPSIK